MTNDLKMLLHYPSIEKLIDDTAISFVIEARSMLTEPIDCLENVSTLQSILFRGIDICINAASTVVANPQTFSIPPIHELGTYHFLHIGHLVWLRIVDLFNAEKFPASNTNNGEQYLTITPLGFVLCMMSCHPEIRRAFVPAFEEIILEEFKNAEEIADATTESPTESTRSMPYEIRDTIFEDSGLSELIQTFQKLGTYRPDRKYDDPEKIEYHNRIEELLNQLFTIPEAEDHE